MDAEIIFLHLSFLILFCYLFFSLFPTMKPDSLKLFFLIQPKYIQIESFWVLVNLVDWEMRQIHFRIFLLKFVSQFNIQLSGAFMPAELE